MESILATAIAFAILLWFAYRGLGLSRIQWWNSRRMKSLRLKIDDPRTEGPERSAGRAVLTLCKELDRKWVLEEDDLDVPAKTMALIESVASAWNPRSSTPVLETRLGTLFKAAHELNERLGRLTRLRGIRSATRFRIRHVLLAARAWEKKRSFEAAPTIRFLRRTHLDFVIQWVYAAFRFFDLSFWMVKMAGYLIQDVWLRILLVHFYLTIGELAGNVYRKGKGGAEADSEPLLEEVEEAPGLESPDSEEWPEDLKALVRESRYEILLHTGTTEWVETREVYVKLIRAIAGYYYPDAREPLYEARLYSLLASATRFTESVAALESVPVVQKLLDVKLVHLAKVKETADWLADSQVVDWIKSRGLHKAARYASVLFQLIKRRHPAVLFKEFAWTLTKEGLKRWALLYAHQKIAREAWLVFSFEPGE